MTMSRNIFICLVMRKKGYRICPFKYRVLKFHNILEVVIKRENKVLIIRLSSTLDQGK